MKELTPEQAWEDFYSFIQLPENWKPLDKDTKHYLRKTARQINEAGPKRIRQILDSVTPGRYEFHESIWFTKKEANDKS